jgi:chromosome partitioning protein
MPVISVCSSKGGAGKSTSAVLLGLELAEKGAAVSIIDADRNVPVMSWSRRQGRPDNLQVIADLSEETIIDTISDAAAKSSFVLVDLEGTASMAVGYAISRSDLVIIPCQGSQLDAAEAVKTVKLVRRQEKAFGRRIPCAILFTRTSAAIETRDLKDITNQFSQAGVAVFETRMVERAAFRAIFSYGGTLSKLDGSQVSGIPAAMKNARAFMAEVVSILKQDS